MSCLQLEIGKIVQLEMDSENQDKETKRDKEVRYYDSIRFSHKVFCAVGLSVYRHICRKVWLTACGSKVTISMRTRLISNKYLYLKHNTSVRDVSGLWHESIHM